MFILDNFGLFIGPKGLHTHFYNIGPNFGDGLNFVTCEHSLGGWIHRVHSHLSHSQNGTNRVNSFFAGFKNYALSGLVMEVTAKRGGREP